ncbi:12405_t:CDS:2, partial [Cetraspora pellucida]
DKDSDQNEDSNQEDKDSDNFKALLYGLNKICEITSKIFEDTKESNESVKFIFEIELDEDLINTVALTQQDLVNTNDLKIVKERFNQLAKILAILLDSDSSYYWEIRKTWLKSYKKKFIGSATVHLCCTIRDDRAWKRPNNQPPKRHSEARTPTNRYNCAGKIKLTIIPENKYILVQENHNIVHKNPTYHRVKFPVNAKEWIQNNILLYNFHLEQPNLNNKGFKVLNYLENNFVQALGFLTPLFKLVGINEATKIIVDSTFKTNQE